MGRPYLWGGTSSLAMDCSGFSRTVYFMNGLILARDASLQAYFGETVTPDNYFSNVRPGDLLFFGRKGENGAKDRVTHVGVSMGQNDYIHSSGYVHINSFDPQSPVFSEKLLKSFLWAKRIINTPEMEKIKIKNNTWY
jgi:cell wall-associated NlpC family hydrolase